MTKRLIIAFAVTGTAMLTALGVRAQFVTPQQAGGTVNTALAASDLLYICQPSGTITDPICPIDTSGADETVYVGAEDLVPGSVRWQKLRLRNVGSDPWDVLSVQRSWVETSDPGGLCQTVPEDVIYNSGSVRDGEQLLTNGINTAGNHPNRLTDPLRNFLAIGVVVGDSVKITSGPGQGQSRNIVEVTANYLTVSPDWNIFPNSSSYEVIDLTDPGPGVTILGNVDTDNFNYTTEPVEGVKYDLGNAHGPVAGSAGFRWPGYESAWWAVHAAPGEYQDVLLGIRLPVNTPNDCLNVVWQLTTTWNAQAHFP